ncbi:hypothetical protein BSK59_13895 [Paenibacillus odorifer]|uniref:hypothetical protein n=1 Tax=Paenibacillus odorifer TaxID=189426 RepID=UPI00096C62C1|nr:hypothetical protein [Paenibacillus odorifer]OME55562.1 hypothetical protein BSK59_13895 [Paenibacillus odorifer]
MKYIRIPRGSRKTNTIMEFIKDELKKGERLIMLDDMCIYDINERINKLKKEWIKMGNQIDELERKRNRKLSEELRGYYTYDKDWRDLDRPIVRY